MAPTLRPRKRERESADGDNTDRRSKVRVVGGATATSLANANSNANADVDGHDIGSALVTRNSDMSPMSALLGLPITMPSTTLTGLPIDIFAQIIGHLGGKKFFREDITRLMVSKRWFEQA
ncbi:hypothetical protein B0T26DRAFT_876064 [Lasiosphaeria miniovina]|uniref:F-box domain-containing protein n=1 Tax=Lasiosphaeria miniovina TaxID=1954250 RepID=A0AA40A0K6_9PEZI|nr:uncharacterized protein B0T26DRAFT_876064 [Lasiosphaeria miniovina]KAK0707039.1 hypothetical protein B0T26DRAFT_876064 [Lasiosphaeria miniovina]